jgi:3,4-dihydroxy-2-butanone 4-phosphate synthase
LFNPIPEAVAAVARGEIVVVADDEGRESEGDLITATGLATAEAVAFFVRKGGGLLVAIPESRADEAALPLMVTTNAHRLGVAGQVPLESRPTEENIGYLRTKRDRLGRHLATLDDASSRSSLLAGRRDARQNRHTRQ